MPGSVAHYISTNLVDTEAIFPLEHRQTDRFTDTADHRTNASANAGMVNNTDT